MAIQQRRTLIPIGGGLLRLGETLPIDAFIVRESGIKRPRVLFVPTASKDLLQYCVAFSKVYRKLGCGVRLLRLFGNRKLTQRDQLKKLFETSDIIYVGGGSADTLLSAWKKYNIFPLARCAYDRGAILTGLSAGCALWYQYFFDGDDARVKRGFGVLPGMAVPHFKPGGRYLFRVQSLPARAYPLTMIQDNCAVVYINEEARGTVSSRNTKAFTSPSARGRKRQLPKYIHN